VVRYYARATGLDVPGFCIYPLWATAATALEDEADIARVQEWLGHTNIAITRLYAHRKPRPRGGLA
jgi:site-specific recombinase XerD